MNPKKAEKDYLPLVCPKCKSNPRYTPDGKIECEECGIVE